MSMTMIRNEMTVKMSMAYYAATEAVAAPKNRQKASAMHSSDSRMRVSAGSGRDSAHALRRTGPGVPALFPGIDSRTA